MSKYIIYDLIDRECKVYIRKKPKKIIVGHNGKDFDYGSIYRVVKNEKYRKTYKGYCWEYKENSK